MMRRMCLVLLAVTLGMTPALAGSETVEVSVTPWSGYWWPHLKGENLLGYQGQPAPMEKFDVLHGLNRACIEWERAHHYDPDGEPWAGHCNGWAAVAVAEQEPTAPVTVDGVTFYVGDQKALWTEAYQDAIGEIYGNNPDGSGIDPLTFQTMLQTYLRDNDMPILMDEDLSIEVWTYPIYRYDMSWTDDGNTRHVTITVVAASDFVNPDYVGTLATTWTYTYDLTLSGGVPVSGQWTGDSIEDHPQFLWYPETVSEANPYVTYDRVQQLVTGTYNTTEDDDAEPNDDLASAVELTDHWIGRSLDDDWFRFGLEPEESLTLAVCGNNKSPADYLFCKLYDGNGTYLQNLDPPTKGSDPALVRLTGSGFDERMLKVEYRLNDAYRDNYQFHVTIDSGQTVVPHVTNNPYWTNFVLAGFRPVTEEETTRTDSVFQAVGVANREAFLLNSLPETLTGPSFREVPIDDGATAAQWVKLNSLTDSYDAYSFYLSKGEGSMSFLRNATATTRQVLGHVPTTVSYWWYGLVLLNPSRFRMVHATITLYGMDGSVVGTETLTLDRYEKRVGVFSDFFPAYNQQDVSHMEIASDFPMVASALYGTNDHRELSYVPSQSVFVAPSGKAWVPVDPLAYGSTGWSGLVLVNTSDTAGWLNLTWVLDDNTTETGQLALRAHEKWVGVLEDLAPVGLELARVARLELNPLAIAIAGFTLTGNHEKGTLVSFPMLQDFDGFDEIFPMITRDGLEVTPVLFNQKNYESSQVALQAYDADGNLVGTVHAVTVPKWQRMLLTLSDYYTVEELAQINCIRLSRDRYMTIPYLIVRDPDEVFCEIIPPAHAGVLE